MSIHTIDQAIQHQSIKHQATQNQAIGLCEASGLEVRDVLWMLGMCAASLSLTPFVAFYLLLVA